MLTLSPKQIEAFHEAQLQRFENSLLCHLRERFSDFFASMDEATARKVIRQGSRRAETYGIVSEYDIRRFVEFFCEFRGKFEEQDWVSSVLKDPGLSGDQKMDRLDALATFSARQPR